MGFTFPLAGRRVVFLGGGREIRNRDLDDADFDCFRDWARRYETIVREDNKERSVGLDPLLGIGRQITAWLDEKGWMADLGGNCPLALDIAVGDSEPAEARASLDVPWEVMAAKGPLAGDAVRPWPMSDRREASIHQESALVQTPPMTPRSLAASVSMRASRRRRAAHPRLDHRRPDRNQVRRKLMLVTEHPLLLQNVSFKAIET